MYLLGVRGVEIMTSLACLWLWVGIDSLFFLFWGVKFLYVCGGD